jgi:O-antigen ligase
MTLNTAPTASSNERAQKLSLIDYAIIIPIIIVPMMGTFIAPDQYFSTQDDSLRVAMGPPPASEGGLNLGKVAFYSTLLWLLFKTAGNPAGMLVALRRVLLPLCFVGLALVSASWAPDFSASFSTSARLFIIAWFGAYLAYRCSNHELVGVLTISFLISGTGSLIAVLAFPQYGYSSLNGYADAWRGLMVHKNMLGALMSYGVLVAYYSISLKTNGRAVSFLTFAICLLLLVMSRSATSFISVAVVTPLIVFCYLVDQAQKPATKFLLIMIGAVVVGLIGFLMTEMDAILASVGRSATLTGRSEIWPTIWALIWDSPIRGHGHAFWSSETPLRLAIWTTLGWVINNAHNTFLDIWFQLGLPGLVIFFTMLALCFLRSGYLLTRGAVGSNILFVAIVCATLVRSFTETNLVEPGMPAMFWFAMAYAALVRETNIAFVKQRRPFRGPRLSPRLRQAPAEA